MQQALISFIHSIGWEPFLYSQIIDCMEQENISGVCEEIGRWIFNEKYQAIGGLLDRRREEISLFVTDLDIKGYKSTSILLKAFNDFTGKGNQFKAIQRLEEGISPYLLTEFSNDFNENPEKVYEYFGYDFVISV
jgi:hypothetical protein